MADPGRPGAILSLLPRAVPARTPGALRAASLSATLAALLALLLAALLSVAACRSGEPPASDLSLLPLAAAAADPALPPRLAWQRGGRVTEVAAVKPARLMVGDSERLAVLTRDGLAWEVEVTVGEGDVLAFSAAAPGGADGPRRGVVALLADGVGDGASDGASDGAGDGAQSEIGRFQVGFADGWAEQRLRFPVSAHGRLRLASGGEAPLAWSEVRLLRAAAAPPRRPNVLLVSIDTLRADSLSLYGAKRPTSPHLDAFAADALVFERALSTSTWTLPSHGSLFTGLLPDRHALLSIHDRLSERALTVAERLRRLGYRTAAFTDGGFLHPRWGLSRGFDRWDVTPGQAWQPKDVAVIAGQASRWLQENRFAPFFLFVHTYETHQPYRDREGFAERFLPPGAPRGDSPNVVGLDAANLSAAELERIRALYDAGVSRADHFLGALLEELARSGRLDDTAVIVTSDHGEELGDHGRFEHALGRVWDECVHVPLIVRPPGGVAPDLDPAARRPRVPVTSLDVAPTILAWAGAADPSLPGRPLLELAAAEREGVATAADAGRDRPLLIQGINSLPELNERRYRLDEGDLTLVFDRVRGEAVSFDRGADAEMRRGLALRPGAAGGAAPAPELAALLGRLQAVLTWSAGQGAAAALPAAATSVRVEPKSALAPRGVWDALSFRAWPQTLAGAEGSSSSLALTPGWPALLVFDLLPGERPRRAWLAGPWAEERQWLPRPVPRLAAPGWSPLHGAPPAPGEIFPAAARLSADSLQLSDEARRELRALGYLR